MLPRSSNLLRLIGARVKLQDLEQFADLVILLRRMAHLAVPVQRVAASTSDPLTSNEAAFNEVGDDPLHCSLGDPDGFGDVAQPRLGVACNAKKHLGVVRDEAPGLRGLLV